MRRITGPTEDMTAWYAWNDRMYRDTVLIFLENIRTVPILREEIRYILEAGLKFKQLLR